MSSSDCGAVAPAPKRLRVSRACEQCRAKKIKCDGSQPTCRPCAALAVACSYGSAPPKKRGLAPGSVSALERSVKLLQRVLGLLLLSVESADCALLALVLDNADLLLLDDSEDGGRRLTRAWKAGCVAQALDALQASAASGGLCGISGESPMDCEPTEKFRQACVARFRVEVTLDGGENDGDDDKPTVSSTPPKNHHHHRQQQHRQQHTQQHHRHHQQQPHSTGVGESGGPVQDDTNGDGSQDDKDGHGREDDMDGRGPEGDMDGDRPEDDMDGDSPEDSNGLFGMGTGMGMGMGMGMVMGIAGGDSHSLVASHQFEHPFSPPPLLLLPPPDASNASSAGTPSASLLPPYSAIYIPRSELASPSPVPAPASTPTLHQQLQGDRLMQQTAEVASIPPNARLLLDIYFSYTHAWFPILDKHDIVRLLHTINAGRNPSVSSPPPLPPPPSPHASSLGKRALLYALLALSSAQHEGMAATEQQQQQQQQHGKDGFRLGSAALYMSAQQLLFASTEYGLEHVQALLLLSLASVGQLQLSTAWLLVGFAGRIATDIGLNVPNGPPFARRTWMGYLALESLMALWTGRQPLVADSDWDVVPVAEDGWEEWDEWKGVPAVEAPPSPHADTGHHEPAHVASVFNQLAGLCRIVRRIASQPGSHRHPDDCPEPELELPQRTVLLQQLCDWARNLPRAFALAPAPPPHPAHSSRSPQPPQPSSQPPQPVQPSPSSEPHTLNLHLLYLHALLWLHQTPLPAAAPLRDRLDGPSRAIKEAAVASTEALLVAFRAQRSLAVAPGPFVHYAAAAISGGLLASDGTARRFSDDLTALGTARGFGFEPGRALLRSMLLLPPPPPPKLSLSPVAATSSPRKRHSSPLPAFAPPNTVHTFYSASPVAAPPVAVVASSCSPPPPPSMGTALLQPARQPAPLPLREAGDLDASNIAASASAAFPPFHQHHQHQHQHQHHQQQQQQQQHQHQHQHQPAVSSDTFDDEFGMFDLPWAHNAIPEFMQNLGYVGLSPDPGPALDLMGGSTPAHGAGRADDGAPTPPPHANIYAGRGLNTVLEQYLGDVLGAASPR